MSENEAKFADKMEKVEEKVSEEEANHEESNFEEEATVVEEINLI